MRTNKTTRKYANQSHKNYWNFQVEINVNDDFSGCIIQANQLTTIRFIFNIYFASFILRLWTWFRFHSDPFLFHAYIYLKRSPCGLCIHDIMSSLYAPIWIIATKTWIISNLNLLVNWNLTSNCIVVAAFFVFGQTNEPKLWKSSYGEKKPRKEDSYGRDR